MNNIVNCITQSIIYIIIIIILWIIYYSHINMCMPLQSGSCSCIAISIAKEKAIDYEEI